MPVHCGYILHRLLYLILQNNTIMNKAYLSLGSNLGNRRNNINKAISLLKENGTVLLASSYYETEPWNMREGNNFINLVIAFLTPLKPLQLLDFILEVEKRLGRVRTSKEYESRTIDIDILLYNDEIIESPVLTVPHQYLAERKFVLKPLCEIAPRLVHPLLGKSMKHLLAECRDSGKVRLARDEKLQ